jgi:MOSC domain-containing protein YiiM
LSDSSKNSYPKGKVTAISISQKKGISKLNIKEASLIKEHGIKGDAHSGNWHRQVSLLAFESIEKMRNGGLPNLRPGAFAENITTKFIDIPNLKIGTNIRIGKDAEIEITQIGKECHSKCSIFFEVGDCVMPREGIFAKVIKSGSIAVGDAILVID